jgi:glycosyltransferase involved in cell wall biosynthesis
MRVLMISRDRNIFNPNSDVRQRMIEYGKLVEKLHIIVLSRPFKLLKIGKSIKGFDLITAQDPFEAGLVGWVFAKMFGASLQLQIHTDFLSPYFARESLLNRIRVLIAKFLIPHAVCIRVASERIKDSLLRITNYELRITNLSIFVDVEKIKNAPIRTDLHAKYPQFDFTILMASRLTKEKNIPLAIDVIKEICDASRDANIQMHANDTNVGLIIVGDGPEKQNLKSQISNLKINENIKIENWTDDLISYYKTADLFLLTSHYEGYGRTLVEAVAAGCKIISSDVGIAGEILPKENIFEVNNKEQLKEKIIKAIKGELPQTKFRSKIQTKTKEEYLEEYKKSWKQCAY